MVALLGAIVVLVATVGAGYGYLRYRYDQISKIHTVTRLAAASGAPFTSSS